MPDRVRTAHDFQDGVTLGQLLDLLPRQRAWRLMDLGTGRRVRISEPGTGGRIHLMSGGAAATAYSHDLVTDVNFFPPFCSETEIMLEARGHPRLWILPQRGQSAGDGPVFRGGRLGGDHVVIEQPIRTGL